MERTNTTYHVLLLDAVIKAFLKSHTLLYVYMPWKLPWLPLYNPLKSPVGAHVQKTTYGYALYVTVCNVF
jgi:hypothetical protein